MKILLRGGDLGMPVMGLGILYTLFTIGKRAPELRRSQIITLGGFLYFIALIIAWICYAAARGI
jgi:hypothetical protein